MTPTRTTVWVSQQTLTASALNGEFNNLLSAPSIVNADIASGAAIVESKVLFSGSGHGHTGGTDGKLITINRAFGFFVPGTPSVANDLSWNPTAPQGMTAIKIWAYARTAPSGASLTVQVYDVTQARVVASVSIVSGANSGNSTSMTNAAITAGDVLRCDVTNVGSSTPGSNVSVILECTQP